MANEPVEATMLVIHALDQLKVPYVRSDHHAA